LNDEKLIDSICIAKLQFYSQTGENYPRFFQKSINIFLVYANSCIFLRLSFFSANSFSVAIVCKFMAKAVPLQAV
jgi:hypothetical protein